MSGLATMLYAVALCALVAGIFATPVFVIAACHPLLRRAVTARNFLMAVEWGTVAIFGWALLVSRS